MKFIYNNKISRWFFKKYFGIDKEIFKVDKNNIHYWLDKSEGQAQCRHYEFDIFNIPFLKNLKRLALLPLLFVKMPFTFLVGLATDVTSTNNRDAYIASGSSQYSNYGAEQDLRLYANGANKYRILINFTLPSGSAAISSVKLFLCGLAGSGPKTSRIFSLTKSWTENGVTWNSDGTNSWTTGGGDYSPTVIDSVAITPSLGKWINFVLMGSGSDNPLTLNWGDNVNLIIIRTDEGGYDGYLQQFASKEYTTKTSYRPYIEITYSSGSSKFFQLF